MNVAKLKSQPVGALLFMMVGSLLTVGTAVGLVYWIASGAYEARGFVRSILIITLFSWVFYGIQRTVIQAGRYVEPLSALLLFLFFVLLSLYSPIGQEKMWVVLAFFPVFISLLGRRRLYRNCAIVYFLYFVLYQAFDTSWLQDGDHDVAALMIRLLFGGGGLLLGAVILHVFDQHDARIRAESFQMQRLQIVNMLQSFVPVGERKTQTSHREITEMGALLRALVRRRGLGGMKVEDWEIHLLSLLHFVSRVKLPDYMFEKEGKLSEYEFEVVQEHCFMAQDLLEGVAEFANVKEAFLYHHEKIDGTGYPYRLSGDRIPLLSQMLGVVEVYLALSAERSYRPAMTREAAYAEIVKLSGTAFRPDLVEDFGQVVREMNGERQRNIRSI